MMLVLKNQQEVADRVGIDRSLLSKWKRKFGHLTGDVNDSHPSEESSPRALIIIHPLKPSERTVAENIAVFEYEAANNDHLLEDIDARGNSNENAPIASPTDNIEQDSELIADLLARLDTGASLPENLTSDDQVVKACREANLTPEVVAIIERSTNAALDLNRESLAASTKRTYAAKRKSFLVRMETSFFFLDATNVF